MVDAVELLLLLQRHIVQLLIAVDVVAVDAVEWRQQQLKQLFDAVVWVNEFVVVELVEHLID
jgi:hypothetical protein